MSDSQVRQEFEPFVCIFCNASLPEPGDYDSYYRCGSCQAVYGFELPEDGFEFSCEAANMLGLEDGEPMTRIVKLEIQSRVFDYLTEVSDPDSPADEIYVFFARLRTDNLVESGGWR